MVTAAATVDFLHEETPLTISRRAFLEGARDTAANTSLMGRWQKLGEQPLTVCDTGHNPHGIAYVARQLKATPHKQLYCVIGFVRDKDLAHILPCCRTTPTISSRRRRPNGPSLPPSLPPKPRSTDCTARPSPKFPPQSPAPRSWPAPTT